MNRNFRGTTAMQQQTEPNNVNNQISMLRIEPQTSLNTDWRTAEFLALAEAFRESLTAELLAIYVEATAELTDEQIKRAVTRAIRERDFFPRVSELYKLAGCSTEEQKDAEAHRAWDVLLDYVDTWIHPDPEGCYGPEQGCRSSPPPKLEQRIVDCARRLGGWRRLKTASEDDIPFLKKDFIEEFNRWEAVERIDVSHMLKAHPKLQLAAKPMEPPTPMLPPPAPVARPQVPIQQPKSVPEPLSPLQLRNRREMLREQAEGMKAKYAKQ